MTVESGHSIQKSTKGLRPRTFLQLFPGTFGLVTCSSHVPQLFFLCFISGCNVQILLCFLNRFKPFHLNLEEGKQLIFFFSSIQFEVCMIYRCLTRPHGTIVQRHALHSYKGMLCYERTFLGKKDLLIRCSRLIFLLDINNLINGFSDWLLKLLPHSTNF